MNGTGKPSGVQRLGCTKQTHPKLSGRSGGRTSPPVPAPSSRCEETQPREEGQSTIPNRSTLQPEDTSFSSASTGARAGQEVTGGPFPQATAKGVGSFLPPPAGHPTWGRGECAPGALSVPPRGSPSASPPPAQPATRAPLAAAVTLVPPRCPCCRQPPVRGSPTSKTRPRHTSDALQPENEIPRPWRWGTLPRPSRISVLGLCSPPLGLWGVREASLLRCHSVWLKQAGRTEVWDGEGGIRPGQRPVWPGWQQEADSTRVPCRPCPLFLY